MNQTFATDTEPVIRLRDIALVLWRRSWVIVLVLAASLGVTYFVTKHTAPTWKASAQILLIQHANNMGGPSMSSATPVVETVDTQVGMLSSYEMAKRTIEMLKNELYSKGESTENVGITPDDFQNNLTVTQYKETNLVDISVEAPSRQRAIDEANAVCNAFVNWKTELAQRNSKDQLNNLQTRAARAHKELVQAEQQETQFKEQNHINDPNQRQQQLLMRYSAQESQIDGMQQDLALQQAHTKSVGDRLKSINAAIGDGQAVRNDALVLSLESQLNQYEIDYAQAAQLVTKDFPGRLQILQGKIDDIKTRLTTAIANTVQNKAPSLSTQQALVEEYATAQAGLISTHAKLDAMNKQQNDLKSQMAVMPEIMLKYEQLNRNAEIARNQYTNLQASLNAIKLETDLAQPNVQISQYGFAPDDPYKPNKWRNLALGGTLGLLLSIASVMLMETSDRRLRSLHDVRRLAAGPVIGSIPRLTRTEMLRTLHGQTPPPVMESYSLARANLSLALRQFEREHPVGSWTIMITSAVPGEGKSFTSAQLALSMARSGKSVILVDADMRRPTLARLFHSEQEDGLADVLAGKRAVADVLEPSGTELLGLMPSGRPDISPTDLISRPQMAATLETLKQAADVVIIDTPACSVVADALLLAPHVDCILHVVGAGQVDDEVVRETASALRVAGPKSMLYVMNGGSRKSRYGYHKYYADWGGGNGSAAGRNGSARTPAQLEPPRPKADEKSEADDKPTV